MVEMAKVYMMALVLDFQGRFDIGTRLMVREAVKRVQTGDCQHLVFNLKDVDFMDSAALGLMVVTHHIFTNMNRQVSMLQPQRYVKKSLDACSIELMMTIYESEAELLADAPVAV